MKQSLVQQFKIVRCKCRAVIYSLFFVAKCITLDDVYANKMQIDCSKTAENS